ncbi:uncharacterized protein LOC102801699 [Saccoglossus kowalevskii]|uniref:Uncharacterized protein LOC102801699 n=1 Tax=Saccoglossus kowalevskii TaxID=10224 RepID=A0ABM0MX33_SACKO|nr:PREDICTED: uncharacterized protein LOC102801699 [Saccoglossus kowalevskii]
MSDYFYAPNIDERGTLFNVKSLFGHRQVKKNVMDCVNHVTDFLDFYTEGMVCLLALKFLNIKSLDEIPNDHPKDPNREMKKTYIDKIASDVVLHIWPHVSKDDISEVIGDGDDVTVEDEDEEDYCICNGEGGLNGNWIECSAGTNCSGKHWYHFECMGVDEQDAKQDWWCDDNCKQWSIFCCKRNVEDTWIGCENGAMCQNGEWFHLQCRGLTELPDEAWYCCAECEQVHDPNVDSINEYSSAVTWRGLYHMVNKDCERENDGDGMLSNWKINMLDFWKQNHNKYLILGHRLISCASGFVTKRVAADMIWNSTANMVGGKGHNLALDLINEFLNNEFKKNLKNSHGQYTDLQIARCSQIVGNVGKDLDKIFAADIIDKFANTSKTSKGSYKKDIDKFVKEYKADHLFDKVGQRYHTGFKGLRHEILIKKPTKLKARLQKYSHILDTHRRICETQP